MSEHIINPFGSEEPSKLFESFYNSGIKTLKTLRDIVTRPEDRKQERTWATMEAAKMVKVSDPKFRNLLKDNKIDGIVEITNKNNKTTRRFTLKAINQLRDLAGTRYRKPPNVDPLVAIVSNLKGGVGKTETAVDLAKRVSIEGLKCLLLDFDAQATATLVSAAIIPDLEIKYEETITNILVKNPEKIRDVIISTHFDGLDIIPANLAIQDCDLLLPNKNHNNHDKLGSAYGRLNSALEHVKDDYDVVIIDCGPNLAMLTLNAVIACDCMIIPIPPDMYDYASFINYAGTLSNLFKNLPPTQLRYLRILLSKHNGSNDALQMETLIRREFGSYVLANHMCQTEEVKKAATEMGTVYDISKPRGSRNTYLRAMRHLEDVNMEIINGFKMIWENESKLSKVSEVEQNG